MIGSLFAQVIFMAEFIVTTLQDETEDNGALSLREAVALANAETGADEIRFDPSLQGGTIALEQGRGIMLVLDDLVIDGGGAITLAGGNRLVDHAAPDDLWTMSAPEEGTSLTLSGLEMNGGGVISEDRLTIMDSTLSGSASGPIYSGGTVVIRNSHIIDNVRDASTLPAILGRETIRAADLEISDSVISGNVSNSAVYSTGNLSIFNSQVSDNAGYLHASVRGSEVVIVGSTITDSRSTYVYAGGTSVYAAANLTIANSTVHGHRFADDSNGFQLQHSVLESDGAVTLFQSTVTDSRFSGYYSTGTAIRAGENVTILNSTIDGNFDIDGFNTGDVLDSAVRAGDGATLLISNSLISGAVSPEATLENANIIRGTLYNGSSQVQAGIEATDLFRQTSLFSSGTGSNGYFRQPIGTLANNGGPNPSLALRGAADNPALDAAIGTPPSEADIGVDIDRDGVLSTGPIGLDARGEGFLRIVGGGMDLGAVELQVAFGTEGTDNLAGTDAVDRLQGLGGDDTLDGAGGNDWLDGGAGNDLILDGAGKDNLKGGTGADIFQMSADGQADGIKDFELGQDRIDVSAWGVRALDELDVSTHFSGKLVLRHGDEVLTLRSGGEPLTVETLTTQHFIFDETGEPPLRLVQGTDGRDKLRGTDLNETFRDGAGIDNMFGFGGADIFELAADGVADSIKDFQIGEDLINISAWGATGFGDLNLISHKDRKTIITYADEILAVSGPGTPILPYMLGAESFIFT